MEDNNNKQNNRGQSDDKTNGIEHGGQNNPPTRETELNHSDYWRANIRLMLMLLSVWFIVSFGFGIILVDWLNQFQFFGFKFGFWWAQQGSICVFVVLILIYTMRMRSIDRQYGVSDEEDV